MSPISSRKIVPPSADSNFPLRCEAAPVNEPFSWPKSSDSSSVSASAAQETLMKGRRARSPEIMDGAGDQLLARSAFTLNEHGASQAGDTPGPDRRSGSFSGSC